MTTGERRTGSAGEQLDDPEPAVDVDGGTDT